MKNCSCGGVVGCLIGVSGVSAAATFAAVAASAVEASSPVCPWRQRWRLQRRWRWKWRLQSVTEQRVVGISVCFGGVGSGGGDNIYEFVFCGVVAG
jgi:hypothetical protein